MVQNAIKHFDDLLSVDYKDMFEWTALHWACKAGFLDIVKVLVEIGGANVNQLNSSHNTPLHIAAKNGFMEICKYLIEVVREPKVDVLIKGLDNETAKDAAIDMGKNELGKYLAFHEKRMEHWKNRNCLLKMYINKNNTTIFKGYTLGIFKEIIKYA